ncbi:MAG: Y-family DNA polymerase [Nostoc sp.]
MDAFYASVEQRDNPSYRGKPLVVGGSPNQRGVVAAASYEARKFGIHSAMPSVTAIAKCPGLIFVRPRFDVYREISAAIHAIFKRYSDLLEGVALDEAYLDVTEHLKLNSSLKSKTRAVLVAFGRSPNHLPPDDSNSKVTGITNNFKKLD